MDDLGRENCCTPTPPPGLRRAPTPAPGHRAPTPAPGRRAPTPTPGPRRAPTPPRCAPAPAPHVAIPTPGSRESSLTPVDSDDGGSDSSFTATKPKSSSQITKPSAANIRTVKSLFQELYPDLTQEGQDREYTGFRARLDVLCTRYLRPSLALSNQEKDEVNKVYTKMTETFQWLTHYNNYWPVSVCLQGKLHNSAACAVEKSTRKVVSAIAGGAPSRGTSRKAEKKRATKKT